MVLWCYGSKGGVARVGTGHLEASEDRDRPTPGRTTDTRLHRTHAGISAANCPTISIYGPRGAGVSTSVKRRFAGPLRAAASSRTAVASAASEAVTTCARMLVMLVMLWACTAASPRRATASRRSRRVDTAIASAAAHRAGRAHAARLWPTRRREGMMLRMAKKAQVGVDTVPAT